MNLSPAAKLEAAAEIPTSSRGLFCAALGDRDRPGRGTEFDLVAALPILPTWDPSGSRRRRQRW